MFLFDDQRPESDSQLRSTSSETFCVVRLMPDIFSGILSFQHYLFEYLFGMIRDRKTALS